MPTSSLLKSYLHNSVAEGLYNEIQNRSARYYYFLGKTVAWVDDSTPPYPIDSFAYELDTRKEIITMKEIKSTDVSFVIPRVDWIRGTIYDMYDDQYSDEVQGINLISGGFGYADPPTITISGGGGTGAVASPLLLDGVVVGIELTSRGRGYTSTPTVIISGGGGEGASAEAVVTIGYSGATKLEDTNSYVLTDEFHVYKCLDNNNNALSLNKPLGTVVDPVIMPDGYMWKYLYSIPIALRNKFLTDAYMPVINSLRSQFYSDGEISNVIIESGGQNYTFANISVAGDGYRESDPLLLQNIQISAGGTGYASGATVTIEPPVTGASAWVAGVGILLGQRVEYNNNIYQSVRSGVLAAPGPTHKSGVVANGTAALEYIGSRATGTVNVSSGVVTSVSLKGSVYEINITDGGIGYTSAPAVTLTGGGGAAFFGSAVMRGTSVQKVVISDSGDSYTSVPTAQFGTAWSSQAEISLTDQIFSSNRLYTVTSATPQLNISKASYTGKSVSVTARDTAPTGIAFSTDGTKMFILGDTGNNIVVYNLSTAWDVSTAVFAYESGALATETSPTGIAFSSNGLKMFIVGTIADVVQEYTLATAWTIPATALTAAASFSIVAQDTTSGGLAFSTDGTKMWMVGSTGDAVYEYTLSTSFSVSTASFTTSFNIATQSTTASDICFSADGKNMLIVDPTTDIIYQYTLGTANSIATAVFTNSFFIGGLETAPTGIFLHPTNAFFYVVGTTLDAVYQYQNLLLSKLGTVAPSHTTGTATNGDVVLTYAGSPATGTAVLKYGAGYTSLPAVQFQPVSGGAGATGYFVGIKSEAKLLPILDSGQIVGIQIDDGGIGYTFANLTVTGDGTQASLTADLSPGDIDTLQANTELLTPDGRIMAYPVISGGFGYGSPPTITIEGDGTGAAATAVVDGGAVTKINVTNYGLGYRYANVTITGVGQGATARAVRAPFGGHGRDPINGMFSRTLMFYTNISKDTNQGFIVNNDFRQLGIIKNPRQFNNVALLKSGLSSTCYVVTGNIDTLNFLPDMDLFLGTLQGKRFRIVSSTPTAVLIQSLDNAIPVVGSVFLNSNSQTIVASGVTAPTADKYSGDILYIDNKQAFTPTADQTVTLRTVIKF